MKWRPPAERFWEKVRVAASGCWEWTGRCCQRGYGWFWDGNQSIHAYKWAYLSANGSIPSNLELDHLCRNPSCVRPSHLEAVTHRINMLRGVSPTAANAVKTQCIHGHAFDADNTYTYSDGKRRCRACGAVTARRRRARERNA